VEHPGCLYERELDDGRVVVVYPLVMGTARLCIGGSDDTSYYDDAWCYMQPVTAIVAASTWDGNGDPPDGWFRNISSGRRRTAGDPTREYVQR
jgi:hypothetical protein